MRWIRTILSEIFGLFVDDGAFAITILLWLIIAGVALPRLGISPPAKAIILFAGLAAILMESALRRARK